MIDISKLSRCYSVRILEESDVDMILEICKQNATFYKYTEARPTKGNILDDMKATPPGIGLSNKYYVGFFNNQKLIAIMDLIDGYPKPEMAYIGFFMMNPPYQGKQKGTGIISDVVTYLQSMEKFLQPKLLWTEKLVTLNVLVLLRWKMKRKVSTQSMP